MADIAEETKTTPPAKDTTATTIPVFGSSTTFGTGSGFGGFGSSTEAKPSKAAEETTGEGAEQEGEEDCSAEFQPVVQLQEVETVSGEEAENVIVDFKCKLYRFEHESGEWKERGVGQVRLLENKENRRIRLLHRQEKTLKIRANHILDFADEEQKPELFCIRFASVERAKEFKKNFDNAVSQNTEVLKDLTEAETTENGTASEDTVKAPATPSAADEIATQTERLNVNDEASSEEPKKSES